MSFIWFLIIGGIIGWLAGMILGKDIPGGLSVILLLVSSVHGLVECFLGNGVRKFLISTSSLLSLERLSSC